ncbi:uncharacterized protein BDW47DRAFT_70731 [Aspergillus candidus]|uniref:Uncharacterized protein n=1 Tax=Aspergillus candidus TaxID=41067 RepID=A0A2I2F2M6_ASPCN|nr:hypothetical protein BDW47DRAFT_70731 [Aspergillus candidus]PLB34846.1 hypothetical protein BDW47DRAFT_70731 [Aspergillus candidus]
MFFMIVSSAFSSSSLWFCSQIGGFLVFFPQCIVPDQHSICLWTEYRRGIIMVPDPVPWFIQLGLRVGPFLFHVSSFVVSSFVVSSWMLQWKNRTCVIMD